MFTDSLLRGVAELARSKVTQSISNRIYRPGTISVHLEQFLIGIMISINEVQETTPISPLFTILLSPGSQVPDTFLGYLSLTDLLALPLVSRHIHQIYQENPSLMARVFYLRFLNIDKSAYYNSYLEQGTNKRQADLLTWVVNQFHFKYHIAQTSWITNNISTATREFPESIDSFLLMQSINESLYNPQPPLPKLRRGNVGQFCHSPYQMMLAYTDQKYHTEDYQCQFQDLKRELFQNPQKLLEYFQCESNQSILKQIRYRPQKIQTYQQTQCPLINLIQLILLRINVYVSAVHSCLKAWRLLSQELEFFYELNCRYLSFRDSVMEIEEKLGFVFRYLDETFKYAMPDYPNQPRLSVSRTMCKMWLSQMSEFQEYANQIACFLLLKQRESVVLQFVEFQLPDKQKHFSYDYCSTKTKQDLQKCIWPSQLYAQELKLAILTLPQRSELLALQSSYKEYLVDMSVNEYNIHWAGSTEIKMGLSYTLFQQELLKTNRLMVQTLVKGLGFQMTRTVLSHESKLMVDSIKPVTLNKMINMTNEILISVQQKLPKYKELPHQQRRQRIQFKPIEGRFSKTDNKIRMLNKVRNGLQQTAQQFQLFFMLDFSLPIQTVDIIANKEQNNDSPALTADTLSVSSTSTGFKSGESKEEDLQELKLDKMNSAT